MNGPLCGRCGERNYSRYGLAGSPLCGSCRGPRSVPAPAATALTRVLLDLMLDDPRQWRPPIRWTPYSVQRRQHCAECVAGLEADEGTSLHQARHKRTANGRDVLLCNQHAELWREAQTRGAA